MTETELENRVINNIKRLRGNKSLTQEKLAELANVSAQMVNNIEGGRRFPSKQSLVKLANALDCDVHEFFIPTAEESGEMSDLYKTVGSKIAGEIQGSMSEILGKYL